MTTEDACKDMAAAMVSITMIVIKEGKRNECLELYASVILMTDLIDYDQESNHACLVKVPPVDGHIRQMVKTTLIVKSFNGNSPRLLKCFNSSYNFLIDSTDVINVRQFENIRVESMVTPCLSSLNVEFFRVKITSSLKYSFRTIRSKIIDSRIEMDYGAFEMHDCETDSEIVIMGADRVLFNRTKFSVNLSIHGIGPIVKISHAESVEFTYCNFDFSKNSQLELRSVVQANINHCNFTYFPVHNPPKLTIDDYMKIYNDSDTNDESDEYASIRANLVFRIFITKCIFTGRREYGWIDWISVGRVSFARSGFTNNYATSAKSVVSLYLCQEVKFVNCFFEDNKAKHSGAILIESSDYVTLKNTRFYNNTSFKSGGAISLLSVSGSTCLLSTRFINNSALNGNGGAVLLDGHSVVRVDSSLFHSNNASIAGGALYIRNTTMVTSLIDSFFVNNRVVLNPVDEEFFKSGHFIEGSGGGLSSINSHTFITSTEFLNNKGLRGGACFSNFGKVLALRDSIMKENSAFIGGAIFHEGLYYEDGSLQSIRDNTAVQYGSNIASTIMNFNISVQDNKNLNSNGQLIYMYPGQTVPVLFFDMYDSCVNSIPLLLESVIIRFNETAIMGTNFEIHVNQTKFSNKIEFHISLKKELIDLKQDNHFTLRLKLPYSEVKIINVHLIPCKVDYVIKDGICQLGFPYSQVIPGIVVASILVMIIGIIIGSCMCSFLSFSIWKIYKKIKKVYVREKSEKEIEEKLLNYDVSYSDYGSLHSVEIEKNANYIIPASELKFEKKIGEGASGSVYQAKWNHTDVAVKTIVRKEGSNDMFEKEVMVLVQLRHVNIINFYGICISETQSYMVVELAQNGSLEKLIKNMKKGTVKKTLKEKLKILIGIANGMKYLHGLQPNYLIHRDLKPANIILDYNDNPKVCDFGLSRTVSNHTLTTSLTANIGTLLYMCPELILEEDNEQSSLSKENAKKIDVYAFAIIMWELFFEETPYWNDTCEKINYFGHVSLDQKKIKAFNLLFFVANQEKRPFIPFIDWNEMTTWCEKYTQMNPHSSDQFLSAVDGYINIMKLCWSTDPSSRPSFEIIMNMLNDLYEMDF